MNILLWILQVLLAAHTAMGAVWKVSNPPAQAVPSLAAIPQPLWLALSGLEFLFVLGLVLPAVNKARFGKFAPLSALGVAAVMILYWVVSLSSGIVTSGELTYWGVVAVFCAFIAYGRGVLKPHK